MCKSINILDLKTVSVRKLCHIKFIFSLRLKPETYVYKNMKHTFLVNIINYLNIEVIDDMFNVYNIII